MNKDRDQSIDGSHTMCTQDSTEWQIIAEMTKPHISKNWNIQESIKTFITIDTRLQVI